MPTMLAELLSPERLVFEGQVRSVVLHAIDGDLTVLPGHEPMMTMLHPGLIFATDAEGKGRRAFISGGFVEISASKVTILADSVRAIEEMTSETIDEEIVHLQTLRDGLEDAPERAKADASISKLLEFKSSLGL